MFGDSIEAYIGRDENGVRTYFDYVLKKLFEKVKKVLKVTKVIESLHDTRKETKLSDEVHNPPFPDREILSGSQLRKFA